MVRNHLQMSFTLYFTLWKQFLWPKMKLHCYFNFWKSQSHFLWISLYQILFLKTSIADIFFDWSRNAICLIKLQSRWKLEMATMAKWFRIHLSNIIFSFVRREVITNFLDATWGRKKCSQFDGRKMTRPKKVFDSINCLSSSFTCVTQARNVTKINKILCISHSKRPCFPKPSFLICHQTW